ncbi:MAG: M48 family metalloprotease [Variovorax sp.]
MDIDRFRDMVARLEVESAHAPGHYRAKVVALTLLGFAILALLFGTVGFGLLVIAGLLVAVAYTSGGAALVLLAKFGKVLFLLAIPLWYLCRFGIRALFVRLPMPQGHEISPTDAPDLFAALRDMQRRLKGPRFHHVLVGDEVNAAVVQRPAFGLVGWPRNYLLLGLPLMEAMPPAEALAVVAHEYGHLAGSHGHFSAFIYRLRHTWGTIQDFTDQIQGWVGRFIGPLVRWYAPYFNAYTFVLARSDEYLADAASADLVGQANAERALKRVSLIAPRHQRFMQKTFERMDSDAMPPQDLLQRWAATLVEAPAQPDARRWLDDALDRQGNVADTHPTLRARLAALRPGELAMHEPPPAFEGMSAAQAWFGAGLQRLRRQLESRWAEQVAQPWSEQHAAVQQWRQRLHELRQIQERDSEQEIELLRLALRLEPDVDQRHALARFNAAHDQHPLGLFLEGMARLDKGQQEGLALLERAMALDPEATKPACERAHAFLIEHADAATAEQYAERWRQRDALEAKRAWQMDHVASSDALASHGLDAEATRVIRGLLAGPQLRYVAAIFVARRIIPADPIVRQFLVGVELTWWGRRRGKQREVVDRLAAIEWPMPVVVVSIDGQYAKLKRSFESLGDAHLAGLK